MPRLVELNSNLSKAGLTAWQVTEGYPPTRVHQAACHNNGTCIDANFTTAATPANITTFVNAANSSGLRAVYEVQTDVQKQVLVDAGVRSAVILVEPNITGPHFSVYQQ
jgi:hypothetical protein